MNYLEALKTVTFHQTIGAPRAGGAPIFLSLVLLGGLAALAPFAWAEPAAAGTSPAASSKVVITADELVYHEETGSMTANGHVRIWYGLMTMTAQAASADLESRWVRADGDVHLNESGREIRCAKLDYDLKTGSAEAQGILFASHPWYYQGKSVKKRGERMVTIEEPLFTTCNCRHPHYHLTSGRIEIELGESLTAYNSVLYVGTTPLFYIPWVWRSIKDHRPPFSIRVGYNSTEGVYVKTKFNYFMAEGNYGSLLLDLMEKKGLGTGLDHRFRYSLGGTGEGQLTSYYTRDKSTGIENWTTQLNHRHEFDARNTLQTNVDYLSTKNFNEQYSSYYVDSYQQKSYLAYSRRMDAYYLGALVQDTELLDPDPLHNQYYSDQRKLPGLSFGLSPLKLSPSAPPVYLSLSSNASRDYQRLSPDFTYRFKDSFDVTPTLTQTFNAPRRILTQPALSASLALPVTGYYKESLADNTTHLDFNEPSARLDASYGTSLSLTNKWVDYQRSTPTHAMQSRLTHSFSRRLAHLDEPGIANAGVTANNLGLGLDYYMGTDFSLQSSTTYNLMDVSSTGPNGDWRAHMAPFSLNGRALLAKKINLNWQGQYHWLKERVTGGYVSTGTFGKNWNASLNTSYAYTEVGTRPYQVYSGFSGSWTVIPQLALQSSLQYNFVENRLNNVSVSLTRDLHCWEMQLGYSHYFTDTPGGRDEIGFGLTVKAFPQLHVGMPASSAGVNLGN